MFNKRKGRSIYFLTFAFFTGLVLGLNIKFVYSAEEPAHKYLDYFHQSYQLIREEYVDTPNTKELFFGAIRGMADALGDPFSRFLDETAYGELKEVTSGQFVGVGIEVTIRENEIVVITPIDDSPAIKAGILAGDVITKVDNTEVQGKNLSEILKLIKGKPGTKVTLYIRRDGFDAPLDFSLERTAIKIKNVDYSMIESSNIGYLKIKNFGSETAGDTADAIKNLRRGGAEKFIVDLRSNPGGLLTAAVDLADMFLEKGQTVVSTKDSKKHNTNRQEPNSVNNIYYSENKPLVSEDLIVLVNKGSASASEIFAGAVRDNKRGKLVGEKTFGKGSVQKTFPLGDNVGIAVTVAKYYTPSGEMIHQKGIVPDYVVAQEIMNQQDVEAIRTIHKQKIMATLPDTYKKYNENSRNAFRLYLKEKNIKLSDRMADSILKEHVYANEKRPIYDTEFDDQLAKAVDILTHGR